MLVERLLGKVLQLRCPCDNRAQMIASLHLLCWRFTPKGIPPAEQARIVRLLVERMDLSPDGTQARLRPYDRPGIEPGPPARRWGAPQSDICWINHAAHYPGLNGRQACLSTLRASSFIARNSAASSRRWAIASAV